MESAEGPAKRRRLEHSHGSGAAVAVHPAAAIQNRKDWGCQTEITGPVQSYSAQGHGRKDGNGEQSTVINDPVSTSHFISSAGAPTGREYEEEVDEDVEEEEDEEDGSDWDGAAGSPVSGPTSSSKSPAATVSRQRGSGSSEDNGFSKWDVGTRYEMVRILGHGSYGEVAEGRDLENNGRKVAIKRILGVFEQEADAKRIYREMFILRRLKHPQIIGLLDIIVPRCYESFSDLYLVFEYVDTDLYKLIMSPQYLTNAHVQTFLYQLLMGLQCIHDSNVIHRDMKPANILLNENCSLKICDFGLSRVVDPEHIKRVRQPEEPNVAVNPAAPSDGSPVEDRAPPRTLKRQLTKHVVTRWYRAPELILLQNYSSAVDVWSLGCIFAELLSMQKESVPQYQDRLPIFPGRSCFPLSSDLPSSYSDKLDQLNVICSVIGTPSAEDMQALGSVTQYVKMLKPQPPKSLRDMYVGASESALELLQRMLHFNPAKRITVEEALKHEYIASMPKSKVQPPSTPIAMEFENSKLDRALLKKLVYSEVIAHKHQQNPPVPRSLPAAGKVGRL